MRRFPVEAYVPGGSSLDELDRRAQRAVAELSRAGRAVRYERAIFVPEDETCFYLLAANSHDDAADALCRAGVSPQRVTEAVRADADREEQQ